MSIADLAVRIVAQVDNFNSTMQSVSGQVDKIGANLQNVGKGMTDVGKKMTVGITLPVVGLVGSLVKTGMGFKIFKQESQQAFSVLLGSAEAATKHMDNILAFAKTTPFAFPDLVSANRKLVSFGMTAQDTEPVMEAIANATAAMGGGTQELGELADVFAKITANGKITGQELNRLGDKGINALAIMANQAGVSVDEMRKQISSGAIDSKTAIDWLVDGVMNGTEGIAGSTVAMGGSLEALKDTWGGALDSMKAAWRNAGDELVSDEMFDKIIEGIHKLTGIIKELPEILGPVADTLGDVLLDLIDGLSRLLDWFSNLNPETQQFVVKLGLLAVAAGPVLMVVGKITQGIGTLLRTVNSVSRGIGLAGDIIKKASDNTALISAKNSAKVVGGWIKMGATAAAQGIKVAAQWTGMAIKATASAAAQTAKGVAQVVAGWIKMGIQSLLGAAKVAAAWLISMGPIALVIAAVVGLVAAIVLNWDKIKSVVGAGISWITTKFSNLETSVTTRFNQIKTAVTTPIDSAMNSIKSWIGSAVSWMTTKFNGFRSTVSGTFNQVKSAITGPISSAISIIKSWLGNLRLPAIKIPKIKLPHFKITGGFSITPPKVPKFSVSWYDKGGIFPNPSVIGISEKRPEFVGALDDLRYIVRDELNRSRPAVATAGGPEVHLHIGTLVADEMGLKKLEQTLRKYRKSEDQRRGN